MGLIALRLFAGVLVAVAAAIAIAGAGCDDRQSEIGDWRVSQWCPFKVPVSVATVFVRRGVELSIRAAPDDVEYVRASARRMARFQRRPAPAWRRGPLTSLPPFDVLITDLADGVTLRYIARDPLDIDRLREQIGWRASRMRGGACRSL